MCILLDCGWEVLVSIVCNHGIKQYFFFCQEWNNDKTFIHQRAYWPFFRVHLILFVWCYGLIIDSTLWEKNVHFIITGCYCYFCSFFFFPFLVRWWSVFLSLLSFPLVIVYLVLEQISNAMLRFCLHLDYYILIQESLR